MKKVTFFENEDLDNILRGLEGLTIGEKEAYLEEQLKKLDSLSDNRKKEIHLAARAGIKTTLELASHVSVMNELQDIESLISFSSVAKDYFGKSKSWIHQRLNGNLVNGKPAYFTDEEIFRMAEAFDDIAKRMEKVSKHLKEIVEKEKRVTTKLARKE